MRAAPICRGTAISTYIRGKVFPSPKSLQKLGNALTIAPGDLLPNAVEGAYDEDDPEMEMTLSAARPGYAWLWVNRLLPIATASQIVQMVSEVVEGQKGKQVHSGARSAQCEKSRPTRPTLTSETT